MLAATSFARSVSFATDKHIAAQFHRKAKRTPPGCVLRLLKKHLLRQVLFLIQNCVLKIHNEASAYADMMLRLHNDVVHFIHNDAMFANNISEATSLGEAVIIGAANIICRRQTSLKKPRSKERGFSWLPLLDLNQRPAD